MSTIAKHTPGPWAWFGNARTNSIYLATVHGGRRFVMDFTRWGMRGAQPRFQTERGIMVDAKDLLQFEVGDRSVIGVDAAKKDGSVYRLDIRGVASADARLIAAAPDLLEALQMLHKWFDVTGSSINARWERIPPLERKAIVDATRAAIAKTTGEAK